LTGINVRPLPIEDKNSDCFRVPGIMDRKMELDHLARAEKTVALGERHIEREEQMIADLDRAGHDTRQARALLATYRLMQAEHIAHRNRLLEMLRQSHGDAIFQPGHYEGHAEQGPARADPPKGRAN
jgi:hypothetical protein